MKKFIVGFIFGAFLFGAGWSSAKTYYDIDDVMSRLDDVEQNLESSIILWCD